MAFSPDGKLVAGAGCVGIGQIDDVASEVIIWDAQTGRKKTTLRGHTGSVRQIAFSPDGKYLISISLDIIFKDNTIRIWDLGSGKELHAVRGRDRHHFRDLAFSPTGDRFATVATHDAAFGEVGHFGLIQLWAFPSGRLESTNGTSTREATSVAFSPNGKWLASCGELMGQGAWAVAEIWDLASWKVVRTFEHDSPTDKVLFSPDGTRLATASGGFTKSGEQLPGGLTVWDTSSGKRLYVRKGHPLEVKCIAYSKDGKRIASGSKDGTIKLWDAATGGELCHINAHSNDKKFKNEILGLAFSPEGDRLASSAFDGTVKIWNVKD